MVPGAGIEPARPHRTTDFKSVASAYSATPAYLDANIDALVIIWLVITLKVRSNALYTAKQ